MLSCLQIGWYNDCVTEPFKFTYDPDTLAFLLISTPSMFEKAFLPFLVGPHCEDLCDPINRCVNYHLTHAAQVSCICYASYLVDTCSRMNVSKSRPSLFVMKMR